MAAMWHVLLALAPWLLLGLVVAGLLHVLLPRQFVRRQLTGPWGVVKAVALGVPLPLCSCGVIPAGLGLRRDGADDGPAVGFLISTPQTGVDSILVSSTFLGWPFALFKVGAALLTGLVGGFLTNWSGSGAAADARPEASTVAGHPTAREGVLHAVDILRMIWRWVVFGVVVSALIEVWVPESFFTGLADRGSWIPVLAALAISLPLYVCATSSVPIAAALVAGGMPAGAALVFLMAGPATNLATIGAIYRALGGRALASYLASIIGGSLAAGLLFDRVIPGAATVQPHLHGEPSWWSIGSAVVLLLLLGRFAVEDLRGLLARVRPSRLEHAGTAPATIDLRVAGMTCGGCTSRLERTLLADGDVESASVSLDPGRAVVRGRIPEERVRHLIGQAGFTVLDPPTEAPSRS